jgi:DNA-binding PadR family transcriptional regulator
MTEPALTEGVYYILLSLTEPLHGYGIMQKTEELSGGRVRLAAGTLYGALSNMVERGWIESVPDEDGAPPPRGREARRHAYRITKRGRDVLRGEIVRLGELYENGLRILAKEEF